MHAYHDMNMFDGAVLVNYPDGNASTTYRAAFGLANHEWNVPNTIDTKFMIGSVSKPFTALLVLVQVQKGLISLDKTIADYLPAFNNAPAANVTIRQLLSHTSGIPNYDIIPDFFPRISRQNWSREEYLKIFVDSALLFKPGTAYSYSSWGYFTLGYIVERVSGKSYAQAMKDDVLIPLGMNSTGSYYHTEVVPKRATGYDYTFGGYTSSDFRDQSNTMGTGDMYSTVEDMLRFSKGFRKLVSAELMTEMLKPGMPPAQYGFGWFNKKFIYGPGDSADAHFHLGMTEGFISFFLLTEKETIVILCNSSPTDFFGIVGNLLKVVRNKPVHLRRPIHKLMETGIGTRGVAASIAEYYRVKSDTLNYYADWISLNFLGEKLIEQHRTSDALLFFEFLAKEFSQRDLINFNLGKTYEGLGRTNDAIEAYKKVLVITPTYIEAKKRLEKLSQAK